MPVVLLGAVLLMLVMFDGRFGQDDGILVIPTVANPPPKLGSKEISSEDYLIRASTLMSLASMSGCCQVNTSLFSLSLSLSLSLSC